MRLSSTPKVSWLRNLSSVPASTSVGCGTSGRYSSKKLPKRMFRDTATTTRRPATERKGCRKLSRISAVSSEGSRTCFAISRANRRRPTKSVARGSIGSSRSSRDTTSRCACRPNGLSSTRHFTRSGFATANLSAMLAPRELPARFIAPRSSRSAKVRTNAIWSSMVLPPGGGADQPNPGRSGKTTRSSPQRAAVISRNVAVEPRKPGRTSSKGGCASPARPGPRRNGPATALDSRRLPRVSSIHLQQAAYEALTIQNE
jgi:hypothetical protein